MENRMTSMSVFNGSWNKITNSNQTDAISLGLVAVAESATKTANRLRTNPGEVKELAQSMATLGRQLTDLTQSASQVADTSESLRKTVEETKHTAEQLDSIFPTDGSNQCVPVYNFGRVVGSFDAL